FLQFNIHLFGQDPEDKTAVKVQTFDHLYGGFIILITAMQDRRDLLSRLQPKKSKQHGDPVTHHSQSLYGSHVFHPIDSFVLLQSSIEMRIEQFVLGLVQVDPDLVPLSDLLMKMKEFRPQIVIMLLKLVFRSLLPHIHPFRFRIDKIEHETAEEPILTARDKAGNLLRSS